MVNETQERSEQIFLSIYFKKKHNRESFHFKIVKSIKKTINDENIRFITFSFTNKHKWRGKWLR